ncbi:MAG: hypothetical protein HQK98_00825 [Nitrospirae bacterium]|nr:hypothetical protein [Nitrospirota bacterium]
MDENVLLYLLNKDCALRTGDGFYLTESLEAVKEDFTKAHMSDTKRERYNNSPQYKWYEKIVNLFKK